MAQRWPPNAHCVLQRFDIAHVPLRWQLFVPSGQCTFGHAASLVGAGVLVALVELVAVDLVAVLAVVGLVELDVCVVSVVLVVAVVGFVELECVVVLVVDVAFVAHAPHCVGYAEQQLPTLKPT